MNSAALTSAGSFSQIVAPIQKYLGDVDRQLTAALSTEDPSLQPLLNHQQLMGGKRIRPVLCLLAGAGCGQVQVAHYAGAAAVELVHLATLVHDDLIDGASLRRQHATTHTKFGLAPSVLLGDYLFTQSFAQVALTQSIPAVSLLAECSRNVCQGEIQQNAVAGSHDPISVESYLAIVAGKTGALCRAACGIGAILSQANSEQCRAFESFGNALGTAFQIIDDCLDVVGDDQVVGKTLGTDWNTRKWTLPIILAANHSGPVSQSILELWRSPSHDCQGLRKLLSDSGAIAAAEQLAKELLYQSLEALSFVKTAEIKSALEQLVEFVLNRRR